MIRLQAWAVAAVAALGVAAAVPAAAQTGRLSQSGSVAVLRGLDKITGQAQDFDAPIGRTVRFGTLAVTVRACRKSAPEEPRETAVFVEIEDAAKGDAGRTRLLSGWMFASSPAINALEHPTYDVWAITCKT